MPRTPMKGGNMETQRDTRRNDEWKKGNLLVCCIGVALFAVYALAIMLFGHLYTATGVISFVFGAIAFLLAFGTPRLAVSKGGPEALFFGMSPLVFAYRYLVIEMILSCVFIFFQIYVPTNVAFFVQFVVLVVYVIAAAIAMSSMTMAKNIREERIQQNAQWQMKVIDLSTAVDAAKAGNAPQDVMQQLNHLSEALKYSDAFGNQNPAIMQIETQIDAQIAVLNQAVRRADWQSAHNLCTQLEMLLNDRNKKLLLIK